MSFFSRFMNQYFLLIACLQLWSLITPVNPASTWGPLIFIFAVSASKEAWDDYNRYLSDKKANEKEVWVVKKGVKKHVWTIFYFLNYNFIPCFLGVQNRTTEEYKKNLAYSFLWLVTISLTIHRFVFNFINEYNLLMFPRWCYSFISVADSDINKNIFEFLKF